MTHLALMLATAGCLAGAEPLTLESSMNRDDKHYMTHSGTAYAVLALALCGEVDSDGPPQGEDGFVSIFDGKSLGGWAGLGGDTSSYYVKRGMLICKPDGKVHIFTDKQYANFILRLQIKLDPGGNNGIGIRAQRSSQPHLDGMEIQVLDDDYYADGDPIKLKNYQHHGSIYGVVPAKTGHLKPAGQWNDEEILCDGSRLRVTLNGTVIVDADLSTVQPIDGNTHPGLKHDKGHIGLHAHGNYGAEVSFRNMRLKQLP